MGFEMRASELSTQPLAQLAIVLSPAEVEAKNDFATDFDSAALPHRQIPTVVPSSEAITLLTNKTILSAQDIARLFDLAEEYNNSAEISCDVERQIYIDSSSQITKAAERLHELTVQKRFVPGPLVDSLGLVQAGMSTSLGSIVSCLRQLGIVAVGVIAPKDWEARSFVWRLYYQP